MEGENVGVRAVAVFLLFAEVFCSWLGEAALCLSPSLFHVHLSVHPSVLRLGCATMA